MMHLVMRSGEIPLCDSLGHEIWGDLMQGSYKKSFHNSQTFRKHLQHVYGAEKQHESTQLFRTSSKGV